MEYVSEFKYLRFAIDESDTDGVNSGKMAIDRTRFLLYGGLLVPVIMNGSETTALRER